MDLLISTASTAMTDNLAPIEIRPHQPVYATEMYPKAAPVHVSSPLQRSSLADQSSSSPPTGHHHGLVGLRVSPSDQSAGSSAWASSTAGAGSSCPVADRPSTGVDRFGSVSNTKTFKYSTPDLPGILTSSPSETASMPFVNSPRITEQKRPTDRPAPTTTSRNASSVTTHAPAPLTSEHSKHASMTQQDSHNSTSETDSVHEQTEIVPGPLQLPSLQPQDRRLLQLSPIPPTPAPISHPAQPQALPKSSLWGFCKDSDVSTPVRPVDGVPRGTTPVPDSRPVTRFDANMLRDLIREVCKSYIYCSWLSCCGAAVACAFPDIAYACATSAECAPLFCF